MCAALSSQIVQKIEKKVLQSNMVHIFGYPASTSHTLTLGTKKMLGDFSAQLQVLYSFNDGIFCKKSKVYSISDLAKKEFSRLGQNRRRY